jgi:hypothetical protein
VGCVAELVRDKRGGLGSVGSRIGSVDSAAEYGESLQGKYRIRSKFSDTAGKEGSQMAAVDALGKGSTEGPKRKDGWAADGGSRMCGGMR